MTRTTLNALRRAAGRARVRETHRLMVQAEDALTALQAQAGYLLTAEDQQHLSDTVTRLSAYRLGLDMRPGQ